MLRLYHFAPRLRLALLKMRRSKGLWANRPKVLCCVISGAAIAALVLLYVLSGPSVVVQKAILEGRTLHTALSLVRQHGVKSKTPLLVLFTSFQLQPGKEHIFRNTLRNWARLRPLVLPVLYNDNLNSYWVEVARASGWHVLPVPKRYKNTIPILRHMFLNATYQFTAAFYGYANADVLFDESLIYTLWSVTCNDSIKRPFVIGRRSNYNVKREKQLFEPSDVRRTAKRHETRLFISDAQDYFITARYAFPWHSIPDFVIGRIGYDNWLVSTALANKNTAVIDATNTILCLHQSGDDGDFAGFGAKKYVRLNLDLAGADFNYDLGRTDCAPWETAFNDTLGTIQIQSRLVNPCPQRLK